jgi:hypothetical protein
VVKVNLLPQDATLAEKIHVVSETHAFRETILQSADDARRLVKPGRPGSKVKVWDAERWTGGDIAAYLGTDVELLEFPAIPGQPPTPAPTPTPTPTPAKPAIIGVHHRADGGGLREIDIEAIRAANLTGYKFYKAPPDSFAIIRGLDISLDHCLVRLDHPLEVHRTAYYVDGSRGIWDRPIQEALAAGVSVFEMFNEPNILDGGLASMWRTPGEFGQFCATMIRAIRAIYPKVKILAPAMSPQANTPLWWDAMQTQGVFAMCDGIAAHAYWPARSMLDNDTQGRHYRGLLRYLGTGKQIWITEASNNQALDSDEDKGRQYVEYARTLEPQVAGVWFFCLSASRAEPGDSFNLRRETWVRPGALKDNITPIPGIIGARPR